jgi:hypothetical protein
MDPAKPEGAQPYLEPVLDGVLVKIVGSGRAMPLEVASTTAVSKGCGRLS